MPISEAHRRAQKKAAGKHGQLEKPLKSGKRLNASTRVKATEIERSPAFPRLVKAAQRLGESGRRQKVLVVPNQNMGQARAAMRKVGTAGTVKNMSGTKRSHVRRTKR